MRILNDGWQPVQEQNGAGTVTANLLTGLGFDEIFRRATTAANTDNPSVTSDYLTDALNSTLALTNASGVMQSTYTYDPYGSVKAYGVYSDNVYQYTGREDDSGLLYLRNRYLLTGVGAFLSEDPIGFAAGQNVYGYVGGNPISYTDPTGEFAANAAGAVAGAIFGGVFGGTSSFMYQIQMKCGEVNWGDVGDSMLLGAVGGAITGASMGAAGAAYYGGTLGGATGALWGEIRRPPCECEK